MIRISIEGQGETMTAAAQDMARQIALFLQQSAPEYQAEQAEQARQARVSQEIVEEMMESKPPAPAPAEDAEPQAEENPDLSDMLAPQVDVDGEAVEEPTGPDPASILAFCVAYGKLHGGPKLKALLKRHQTARISQLRPERYEAFVREATELAPDLAKAHKLV